MARESWFIVRPAYCGDQYTRPISFGPFDTRDEAQESSDKAGTFGAQDFIVDASTLDPMQRYNHGIA